MAGMASCLGLGRTVSDSNGGDPTHLGTVGVAEVARSLLPRASLRPLLFVALGLLAAAAGTVLMSRLPIYEKSRLAPSDLPPGSVRVEVATYGGNCAASPGNVTHILRNACNGLVRCLYELHVSKLGDPAPGCAKDFSVTWGCVKVADSGQRHVVPAEAGLGSVLALDCGEAGN